MSFAARAQASHARLRSHFGAVTVTIRDGVGVTTMAVQASAPISHSLVSDTGEVDDYQVRFDHSDPNRTFVPAVGDPISWSTPTAFTGRIKEVHTHIADAVIRYTLICGGTK